MDVAKSRITRLHQLLLLASSATSMIWDCLPRSISIWRSCLYMGLFVGLWLSVPAALGQSGQTTQSASAESGESAAIDLVVGFNGTWKLGQVCPVRVRWAGSSFSEPVAAIRVRSVDGDGVEVSYVQQAGAGSEEVADGEVWVSARVGKAGYEIQVELLDAAGGLLASRRIASEDSQVLDSDQPLVLALGSSLGLEQLVRTNTTGSDSNFSSVVITDAQLLPPTWRAYSAIDVLVIAAQDAEFLASIGSKWEALDRWIRSGGGCVISLSPELVGHLESSSEGVAAFVDLLPGKILGDGTIADPGVLESLIGTGDPIDRFKAIRLEPQTGRVELAFSDTLSRSIPWWISFAHGHGTIRWVGSDLDDPAFASWEDRSLFWERLIEPYLDRRLLEGTPADGPSGDSSYLGYSDLVGQLRATLDVFAGVRLISFGLVSAILVALLLLIGPLDYFLSVKWLKRPNFSWFFAGGVLLAASAALAWLGNRIHADRVLVNTVQIVDVDAETGSTSGTLWSHIYCGKSQRLDVAPSVEAGDGAVFVDWQGLPGQGLGALNTQLSTDRGMPAYRIEMDPRGNSRIRGVGVPTGGTKGFTASWFGTTELDARFDLRELPGVDQLTGDFDNPFPVDLRDSIIFYHNWFYRLNSRIPAGTAVTISSETIPKDIARKLNERREVDEKVSGTKWDPADRNSIDRLLELMMFHKAATGSNYTSLKHRFQPLIDHSNLLETDYAILICRLEKPFVSLQVSQPDGNSLEAEQLMDRVWCRLLIPVEKAGR